jgi:RNA polymerase sigma-70 factor (ECF subfamily)
MACTLAPAPHSSEDCLLRHQPLLLGKARRLCRRGGIDPEDLVQDTLERALRRLDWLSAQGERTCRAWLCTTLQRRFLDLYRRRRTESADEPDLTLLHAPVVVREPRAWQPWEHVSEEQLREAVARLKTPLRDVFELHATGLRYKAIAQRLGAPVGTVGCWLFQARRDLRELLRPYTEQSGVAAA